MDNVSYIPSLVCSLSPRKLYNPKKVPHGIKCRKLSQYEISQIYKVIKNDLEKSIINFQRNEQITGESITVSIKDIEFILKEAIDSGFKSADGEKR